MIHCKILFSAGEYGIPVQYSQVNTVQRCIIHQRSAYGAMFFALRRRDFAKVGARRLRRVRSETCYVASKRTGRAHLQGIYRSA